jgi:U3 small nucleolar RNA-associated protein 13
VVASASADGTLRVWALGDCACLKTMEGHEGSVLKLAFVCSGMQVGGGALSIRLPSI